MAWSPLASVWIASLSGSVHCTGMCGVMFLNVTGSNGRLAFLYHFARGMTYVILGACFGVFSQLIYLELTYEILKVFFSIGFSLYVVWLGFEVLWFRRSISIEFIYRWLGFERLSKNLKKNSSSKRNSLNSVLMGIVTAFLPCGWLLSFLGISLASRSAGKGALIMMAFWVGTIPWMEALRFGRLNVISLKLSNNKNNIWIRNAIAIVLMANGAYFMFRHTRAVESKASDGSNSWICGSKYLSQGDL